MKNAELLKLENVEREADVEKFKKVMDARVAIHNLLCEQKIPGYLIMHFAHQRKDIKPDPSKNILEIVTDILTQSVHAMNDEEWDSQIKKGMAGILNM